MGQSLGCAFASWANLAQVAVLTGIKRVQLTFWSAPKDHLIGDKQSLKKPMVSSIQI